MNFIQQVRTIGRCNKHHLIRINWYATQHDTIIYTYIPSQSTDDIMDESIGQEWGEGGGRTYVECLV